MADFFDGSYVVYVCESVNHRELGKKKFSDLSEGKEWAKKFGRKHMNGKKFLVSIRKDHYHTVFEKYMR